MTLRVHLSRDREQTARMHHRAMHQINQVVDVCLHSHSGRSRDRWTCLRREKQLELYAKKTPSNMDSVFFMGVNEIQTCGFEEVVDMLNFDTTRRFRFLMSSLHGSRFQDGTFISMGVEQSSSKTDALHAAVWFLLRDRHKTLLARETAFTFFQTLMIMLPERGDSLTSATTIGCDRPSEGVQKRTLVLNWLPFPIDNERDGTADTSYSHDSVELQYTLLVEEIERGRLRISCVASSFQDGDALNSASSWSTRRIARRMVLRSIGRLESAVAAARLSHQTIVSPHQWVKNEDRASCVICWKSFNAIFRRRHHCRLCGDVICSACCSLRRTSATLPQKEFQKVRVCHLCSNKSRAKVKTDSFASTTDTFPCNQSADEDLPTAKLLPQGRASVHVHQQLQHYYLRHASSSSDMDDCSDLDNQDEEEEDDEDDDDDNDDLENGYMGAYPRSAMHHSEKLISFKTMSTSRAPATSITKRRQRKWRQEPPDSFSFLHPAALQDAPAQPPMSIVANVGSYGDYGMIEAESEDLRATLGRLDQYYMDEGYFSPKLDPEQEAQRLKLMNVLCSPACTLVDRVLMNECCETAAYAFGVRGAFIARIEEHHAFIEHSIGEDDRLLLNSCFLRHETLCDYVLVQPEHRPLVVLDCKMDARTYGNHMTQLLSLRFFVGVCIRVRGLPVGCLCAFEQETQTAEDDESPPTSTTRYDLTMLENAAQSIETELEKLIHGLAIA